MDVADNIFSYMDESFQIRTVGMVVAHAEVNETAADEEVTRRVKVYYQWR